MGYRPEEEIIEGYQCTNCGTIHLAEPPICRDCGCREFTEVMLDGDNNIVNLWEENENAD